MNIKTVSTTPSELSSLSEELAYFNERLAHLLKEHPGKFALVKGRQLVGTFDSADNAYVAGVEKFGVVPFLVREITESDRELRAPALCLGLLSAGL